MCDPADSGTTRPDLDALVTSARNGKADATSSLLEEFDALLRAYLERRAGGRLKRFLDVEDLVQEVHTSLLGGLDRLRPGATAEDFRKLLFLHAGWVLGKTGRRAGGFDGESAAGEREDPEADAPSVGTVTRRDRDAWLAERIGELSEGDEAVLSGFLAGKSFAEIAAGLEISEEAARKRFLRASARLADSTPEAEKP